MLDINKKKCAFRKIYTIMKDVKLVFVVFFSKVKSIIHEICIV